MAGLRVGPAHNPMNSGEDPLPDCVTRHRTQPSPRRLLTRKMGAAERMLL